MPIRCEHAHASDFFRCIVAPSVRAVDRAIQFKEFAQWLAGVFLCAKMDLEWRADRAITDA